MLIVRYWGIIWAAVILISWMAVKSNFGSKMLFARLQILVVSIRNMIRMSMIARRVIMNTMVW